MCILNKTKQLLSQQYKHVPNVIFQVLYVRMKRRIIFAYFVIVRSRWLMVLMYDEKYLFLLLLLYLLISALHVESGMFFYFRIPKQRKISVTEVWQLLNVWFSAWRKFYLETMKSYRQLYLRLQYVCFSFKYSNTFVISTHSKRNIILYV